MPDRPLWPQAQRCVSVAARLKLTAMAREFSSRFLPPAGGLRRPSDAWRGRRQEARPDPGAVTPALTPALGQASSCGKLWPLQPEKRHVRAH